MATSHIRDDLAAHAAANAEAAAQFFGGHFDIEVTPATPEQCAARVSDLVTVTVTVVPAGIDFGAMFLQSLYDFQRILPSDVPSIEALVAKPVEPAPEPVLCIEGQQVSERELAEALQLLRARQPQPVSTPRGLLVVAGFDHRLGRWNEA